MDGSLNIQIFRVCIGLYERIYGIVIPIIDHIKISRDNVEAGIIASKQGYASIELATRRIMRMGKTCELGTD